MDPRPTRAHVASVDDFEAISPFYNKIAEEVARDPYAFGFGIRGTAVGKMNLRVLSVNGVDPFDSTRNRSYPLTSRVTVMTRAEYGDLGLELFNAYVMLVERRVREDSYLFERYGDYGRRS